MAWIDLARPDKVVVPLWACNPARWPLFSWLTLFSYA